MNDKPDGGPAFPVPDVPYQKWGGGETFHQPAKPGMSLRDWFAGMALQGVVANPARSVEANVTRDAKAAYLLADAMLEAGGK